MKNKLLTFFILCACACSFTAQAQSPKKVMAHYMPWYASKEISGGWGWHWTMNHFNPDTFNGQGQREIASHHYPSIGPYDSSDPHALEYHVLLMKLAGIDGVVVDWYGSSSYVDYGLLRDNTDALFEYTKKAGLLFSVCYEDRTIQAMIDRGHITSGQAIAQSQADMLYLQNNYFSDPSYLKIDNKNVVLNFGPNYYKQGWQWGSIFSVLSDYPLFLTLHDKKYSSVGAFAWPPMNGGTLSQSALNSYLNQFASKAGNWSYSVSGAFPGFHDIYAQAGVGNSYGYLAANNGQTMHNTLDRAMTDNSDFVQLVTWNDHGEGTTIEPTDEYGFRYLEIVQDLRRQHLDATFPHDVIDLEMPERIYALRKSEAGNQSIQDELDDIFDHIVAGHTQTALAKLDTLDPPVIEPPQEELVGPTLELFDNTWKAIPLAYNVTPNTVIEFDFISNGSQDAEINGVGFETQLSTLNLGKIFQIYGSQHIGGMIHDESYTTPGAIQRLKLNVGNHYTGPMNYMVFANDNDALKDVSVRYSNVEIYEDMP